MTGSAAVFIEGGAGTAKGERGLARAPEQNGVKRLWRIDGTSSWWCERGEEA